jgi:hypothetical protein
VEHQGVVAFQFLRIYLRLAQMGSKRGSNFGGKERRIFPKAKLKFLWNIVFPNMRIHFLNFWGF